VDPSVKIIKLKSHLVFRRRANNHAKNRGLQRNVALITLSELFSVEALTDTTPPRTMMGRRPMGTRMKVLFSYIHHGLITRKPIYRGQPGEGCAR